MSTISSPGSCLSMLCTYWISAMLLVYLKWKFMVVIHLETRTAFLPLFHVSEDSTIFRAWLNCFSQVKWSLLTVLEQTVFCFCSFQYLKTPEIPRPCIIADEESGSLYGVRLHTHNYKFAPFSATFRDGRTTDGMGVACPKTPRDRGRSCAWRSRSAWALLRPQVSMSHQMNW